MKSRQAEDVQIDLQEAAELTGYSSGYIRNLVYKGNLKRFGKRSDEKKENGILKRGQKIRVSKQELLAKLGGKESA
jgi:hypothetical protein